MELKFYNTIRRAKERFEPVEPGKVKLYTCGPTVYNFAHIGNFRAYMFEDLLRRTLKLAGFEPVQIMNLTDVDDKTIRDSRAAGVPLAEYTEKYKKAFFEDLETLKIEKAEHYPAATEHIPEMISIIETLVEKGYAYMADDHCVYFSIARFPDYGKLARIDMENQKVGERVSSDEYEKESVADFALWKAWDEKDGDVAWDSPWGRGRPGWHIECSAMSMKYLGKTFDIHTGGVDNMFPHHEDEIAQSEAANGCRFVNFWMHCEHLIVDGKKMSKSLGNFFTLRDLLDKDWTGPEIRWALLSTHYRRKLNFSFKALQQARQTLLGFRNLFVRLHNADGDGSGDRAADEAAGSADRQFREALADDLNISEALAALFALQKESNRIMDSNALSSGGASSVLEQFRVFDSVLGVLDTDNTEDEAPAELAELAERRKQARADKNFTRADALRDEIRDRGWIVEDSPDGFTLKKA